jgi:hypothetical protein
MSSFDDLIAGDESGARIQFLQGQVEEDEERKGEESPFEFGHDCEDWRQCCTVNKIEKFYTATRGERRFQEKKKGRE